MPGNQNADLADTFTYQVACDILAQAQLSACGAEPPPHDSCQIAACMYFRKILEQRDAQTLLGRKTTRPPTKLSLYHLFKVQGGRGNSTGPDQIAKSLLESNVFKSTFVSQLYTPYEAFHKDEYWNAGTVLDANLGKYLAAHDSGKPLIDEGWRY
jgi:hypothetical protein